MRLCSWTTPSYTRRVHIGIRQWTLQKGVGQGRGRGVSSQPAYVYGLCQAFYLPSRPCVFVEWEGGTDPVVDPVQGQSSLRRAVNGERYEGSVRERRLDALATVRLSVLGVQASCQVDGALWRLSSQRLPLSVQFRRFHFISVARRLEASQPVYRSQTVSQRRHNWLWLVPHGLFNSTPDSSASQLLKRPMKV